LALAYAALVCAAALVAAGNLVAAGRRPVPWEKNHLLIGQALYRENCVVCHDIDRPQSKKLGPSFYQLFQRAQMPIAKMKPSREYIKVRIKFGGALMPAFRQWLTDREIDTVIDYIASK
jgi:mono/diheme cytochrome c family protein